MTNQRLQIIAFYVLLTAALVVVFMMWLPFLKLIALGAILAVLFLPFYKNLLRRTGQEVLAAWLTIFIILLIVIVPLAILGQLLISEVVGMIKQIDSASWNPHALVSHLPQQYQDYAARFVGDLGTKFTAIAGSAFASFANIVSNVANFFISFFFVFFTAFYLLRDGEKLKKYMAGIFPLSEHHENLLVSRLEESINGVVKGSFLVALVQGLVGTVGYFIFGLPAALLWGTMTVLAALVPNVGTALVWIPAVIYSFAVGRPGQAVGLLAWSVLFTGTIDNLVSPRIISSNTQIHPLLVLFGVLGGLQLFGVIGVLLGPIFMAVFVTLLDLYQNDLKNYLDK